MGQRAMSIGKKMSSEDGVATAIPLIEKSFGN